MPIAKSLLSILIVLEALLVSAFFAFASFFSRAKSGIDVNSLFVVAGVIVILHTVAIIGLWSSDTPVKWAAGMAGAPLAFLATQFTPIAGIGSCIWLGFYALLIFGTDETVIQPEGNSSAPDGNHNERDDFTSSEH